MTSLLAGLANPINALLTALAVLTGLLAHGKAFVHLTMKHHEFAIAIWVSLLRNTCWTSIPVRTSATNCSTNEGSDHRFPNLERS